MNENAHLLLDKLIKETKNLSISWRKYDPNIELLKPTKKDLFSADNDELSTYAPIDASYVCNYQSTQFFLLAYDDLWAGPFIKLYVQTLDSNHSKLYAASTGENDFDIITELKRLYNLVESFDDPIENSIRDFIRK